MARPKSDKNVVRLSVSLNKEDHVELTKLAEELDLSAAWVIRRAISDFIARHGNQPDDVLPVKRNGPKKAY